MTVEKLCKTSTYVPKISFLYIKESKERLDCNKRVGKLRKNRFLPKIEPRCISAAIQRLSKSFCKTRLKKAKSELEKNLTRCRNFSVRNRVARFFLVKTYPNWKTIPNEHKLYQTAINLPFGRKIFHMGIKYANIFLFKTLQNIHKFLA
jgi:hypothetical protein